MEKTLGYRGGDGGVRDAVSLSGGVTVGQMDKLQATPNQPTTWPQGGCDKTDIGHDPASICQDPRL